MAKTYLGLPFDDDLFIENWQAEPDTVKTALLQSGALADDATIAEKIATGGNLYTIPFYDTLSGEEDNYDGQTDIKADEATGESQTGIVYGRAHGFTARDFTYALSNADPMGHIVSSVAQYHNKNRQKRMIGILNGVFSITGDADWAKHTIDLSVADLPGTKFSDVNAARNNATVAPGLSGASNIHFTTVRQSNHFNLSDDEKPYYQAEVLVYDKIPISCIKNIDVYKPKPATTPTYKPSYTSSSTSSKPYTPTYKPSTPSYSNNSSSSSSNSGCLWMIIIGVVVLLIAALGS